MKFWVTIYIFFPDNGLSDRANGILRPAGIPAEQLPVKQAQPVCSLIRLAGGAGQDGTVEGGGRLKAEGYSGRGRRSRIRDDNYFRRGRGVEMLENGHNRG